MAFFCFQTDFFKTFFCTNSAGFLITEKAANIRMFHEPLIFLIGKVIRTVLMEMSFSDINILLFMTGQIVGKSGNLTVIRGGIIPGANSVDIQTRNETSSGGSAYRAGSIAVVKYSTFAGQAIQIWSFQNRTVDELHHLIRMFIGHYGDDIHNYLRFYMDKAKAFDIIIPENTSCVNSTILIKC